MDRGSSLPRLAKVTAPWLLALAVATSGCGARSAGDGTGTPDAKPTLSICPGTYERVLEQGPLTDPDLVEASGLVASRQSPGVLWSHNDSGDDARLFALRDDGRALARLSLAGVPAIDFEDLALGPCPEATGEPGACLFVADTGNNLGDRDELVVYATPEPAVDLASEPAIAVTGESGSTPLELEATRIWRFPLTFPEGLPGAPLDVEAAMLSADGQSLYFFEKNNDERAHILHHPGPLVPDQAAELVVLGDFASPGFAIDFGRSITAADMHPSGERILLRVYTGIYEYRFAAGQGVADLDAIEPVLVAAGPLAEPQGETVTYDAAGSGAFSVSEDPALQPGQPLHFYACSP